jgi:ribosomal protein S18 acetylase RimI-like enzyme
LADEGWAEPEGAAPRSPKWGRAERPALALRAARVEDAGAVAELIHSTSEAMYERFAGNRGSSLRALRAAFRRRGNGVSREVVTVAELGGEVAGAMAAFPAAEAGRRAQRFLRLLLVRTPPWTWRSTLRIYRLGAELAPPPPVDSFYVDSLAASPAHRRAGVATALLEAATRRAREQGLACVALATAADNADARALYEHAGFEAVGERPSRGGLPGFVAYERRV